MQHDSLSGDEKTALKQQHPLLFQLFDDFDLTSQIMGNETWADLLRYRRDATSPTLSFYVDKVARKRWLPSVGVDTPRPYVLTYASELMSTLVMRGSHPNTTSSSNYAVKPKQLQRAIAKYLPPLTVDFAAKPSHLSCAGGVWLTKTVGKTTFLGHGKKIFEAADNNFSETVIALDLAEQLEKVQEYCGSRVKESLALVNVQPGILVEERFTSPWEGENEKGGIEFKVFTIWGRMWLAIWRPGMDGAQAFLHRDGSNLEWGGKNEMLPVWIDWPHIVSIAEKLGAHKDMFRTDIFVGIPANSLVLRSSNSSREDRLAAVRYVVNENEIHPTEYYHVKGTNEILEEGARLWLAGYTIDRYEVISNSEVPEVFLVDRQLPSNITVPSFEVAGVDLSQYDGDASSSIQNSVIDPFELFDNFDLSHTLVGNETWVDLLEYRRKANFTGLSFYVDKIARRRWITTSGLDIPQAYVLKYKSELASVSGDLEQREDEISELLPSSGDFVAKPTHLSCSGGVWLTKTIGNSTSVGNGKVSMQEDKNYSSIQIAQDLSENIKVVMSMCASRPESVALQNVKPGIMAGERFVSWGSLDDRGCMEFKVHTIWGRAWMICWRDGVDGVQGFFNRDGSHLPWEGENMLLPDWLDWDRIIAIGEQLGAHKDMFRTDIFVGVPSAKQPGDLAASGDPRDSVRYVVSETEIHPTPIRGTERVFDEGGRLWLAGYHIGNFKTVPDSEIPDEFESKGFLSE